MEKWGKKREKNINQWFLSNILTANKLHSVAQHNIGIIIHRRLWDDRACACVCRAACLPGQVGGGRVIRTTGLTRKEAFIWRVLSIAELLTDPV